MSHPLCIVNAFTDGPFTGNPAGVCVLTEDMPDSWMQSVAAQLNVSETAFISPPTAAGSEVWSIRWFTPAKEVELCGHATLAAACVVWDRSLVAGQDVVTFATRTRGQLACRRVGEQIQLDLPADMPAPCPVPAGLAEALGISITETWRTTEDDVLLVLDNESAVRSITPNYALLKDIDCRGVAITARADDSSDVDVVSRFFCPRLAVDEDPVTGSLHASLGQFWPPRLGRVCFNARQASPRGGQLVVETTPTGARVGGRAEVVLVGTLQC